MYENFIRPRVSKENLDSSIETNNDKSCDDDDDYEDNGFNLGERHATDPNAKDLNVNPSKKIKRERRKSKENVKNSKDLEEIEIIKEFHEEIKAKQKYKEQSEFDCENLFRSSFATELRDLVPILRHRAKHEIRNVIFKYQMENITYNAADFNFNKHQNVQNQFNTHLIDTMYNPFNSLPTQHQSSVPSPISQDQTINIVFNKNIYSCKNKFLELKMHRGMGNAIIHITEEKIDSLQ